ncbi:MAG TPA: hypothetical protein VFF78_08855, partial [Anaerolineaceae bacterium]|nr:hypothetical protein [Anaerolineaceae bacterium]
MGYSIVEGVELARSGRHPGLVCKMDSGWLVLADMQYLRGYCILMADPVVTSINDLSIEKRAEFLLDMALIGDELMKVTGAYRINYAIMGNSDPFLHAHIVPRNCDEPEEYLHNQPWSYPEEVVSSQRLDMMESKE